MKIRIDISQGSMDYVMDKEVMDVHPVLIESVIREIERTVNDNAPDDKTCYNCRFFKTDEDEDPCETCLWSEDDVPEWEPVDN